jgi:hypothetical protein
MARNRGIPTRTLQEIATSYFIPNLKEHLLGFELGRKAEGGSCGTIVEDTDFLTAPMN